MQTLLDNLSTKVPCNTDSDCDDDDNIEPQVCKELLPGGSLTCQPATTCSKDCLPGDLCTASNFCKKGVTVPGTLLQWLYY